MTTLVTGGYGLLGTELQKHFDAVYCSHEDLDICDLKAVYEKLMEVRPGTILHLAAYTDVAGAESNRQQAWAVNVVGTQNLVWAAKFLGIKVTYISTDYVFDGERGQYEPWDAPNPVNYYGLTKMAGECVVRSAPASLIVRTSFKKAEFQHRKVVDDLWTSADYVDVIVPKLVEILHFTGLHHLGTGRKRLLDLIQERNPTVGAMKRADVKSVHLPQDVSFGKVAHMDWDNA